jgi:hypothetical protein
MNTKPIKFLGSQVPRLLGSRFQAHMLATLAWLAKFEKEYKQQSDMHVQVGSVILDAGMENLGFIKLMLEEFAL